MSLWSRIANVLRGDRLSREIDEELRSHIEEAIEEGRDPAEARRALGSALLHREASRDVRLIAWLDSLRADVVFGWRQLEKNKVTSAAAILSLALAIGACASAFRIIDALLLRPLPVAEPGRLHYLFHLSTGADGRPATVDTYEYPLFRQMRDSVKHQAELIAMSNANPLDLTFGSDQDMEKAYLQYVSGWMFGSFGLRPALGRLLTENDDLKPGAHPYAVLSHDYWTRRFGRDPEVMGRTFRMGNDIYTIVGVCGDGFTGTQPGTVTDIFVPTMMNARVTSYAGWIRTLVRVKPGVAPEPVRDRLRAPFRAFREGQARRTSGMNQERIDGFLRETLMMEPATSGVSRLQREYRRSLIAISVLVALVLLIACANVANLMTAQAAARAREMALRVSIGAERSRLVQMVLVESALLALIASGIGGAFAWWAAPFIVSGVHHFPGYPVRLLLPVDWRILGFGLGLALAVTVLFGLPPALRASAVKPASALRGGEDPRFRRRLMHALIGVQTAFCFLVLFVAGLFVATFDRLAKVPAGFSAERLLTLETVAAQAQPPAMWDQLVEHLRALPGIDTVALADWPLLSGTRAIWSISIDGGPPSADRAYFLNVSPGWIDAMKIPLIDGRDFRAGDTYPGVAIVNESFAKWYFNGENPLGKSFEQTEGRLGRVRLQIVGLVRDARYEDMRGPILPVVYVPFNSVDAKGARDRRSGTLVVRTSAPNPLSLASVLRREAPRARPEFRVSDIRTQEEINNSHMVRERLLAVLAVFFALVALLLAGVGLYGVLDYSVFQRRREIGIRLAIGARARDIVRRVTLDVFSMVLAGAVAGLTVGMASVRYIETLLYRVNATDLAMLALPSLTILAAALVAAVPPAIRAVRIDPVTMLRAE
ncbi:MAG: ABC transporter permease [Bryobacteraceae bacterium]